MKVEAMEREFRYNGGLSLPDPNPKLAVEEVINLYSSTYPEITTAAIEGPEVIGNKLVYRLTRAIGTKGYAYQPFGRRLPNPWLTIRDCSAPYLH